MIRLFLWTLENQHPHLFSCLRLVIFTIEMLTIHNYVKKSFAMLPHPGQGVIPFHLQGMPIPDPLQKHTETPQRNVVQNPYSKSNDLVSGRFLGTHWPQENQPHFLGANERVVFEDSW